MKLLTIVLLVFVFISCKKAIDQPVMPKQWYRTVIRCTKFELVTYQTNLGLITHYRCIESKIDTVKN